MISASLNTDRGGSDSHDEERREGDLFLRF